MSARAMSRDEVRDVDRRAVEEYHMPSVILMENAGRGVAELIGRLSVQGCVLVCAGKGNNGGDGFVIARHLENRGHEVRVLLFTSPERLSGDAATNYRIIEAAETPAAILGDDPDWTALDEELAGADWIVDALLGTGVTGSVREPFDRIIDHVNMAEKRVMAVDLPSGLDCDTGQPLGPCIRANHTATFVARKKGFDAEGADDWTGQVHVIDIGVPRKLIAP